jgi:hypothetical protein
MYLLQLNHFLKTKHIFKNVILLNVGYKSHTDCVENSEDKRDRMATVLVYLDTVTEGGETDFPG